MPPYSANPLDQEVNTELMRVCKCIIPYLDRGTQKNVAIGLKFLELVNTINTYSNTMNLSRSLSLERQGNWENELLHNVKSNLSPEKAYLIDALMKLQEFRSIVAVKETDSPKPSAPVESFVDEPLPSEPIKSTATKSTHAPRRRKPTQKNTFKPDVNTLFEPEIERTQPASSAQNAINPAQLFQALSPMLDDKQKQMLTMFSTLLNTNNK